MMRTHFMLLVALVLSTASAHVALAQQYDLVATNGRVMDPETMFDDIAKFGVNNVGVNSGRIATITKKQTDGKETIDATCLVVSPGFIDTHYHAVAPFATKLAVADGIATGMAIDGASRVGEWYARKAKSGRHLTSTHPI